MTDNQSTSPASGYAPIELSVDTLGKVRVTFEAFSDDLDHEFTDGLIDLCQQAASLSRTSTSTATAIEHISTPKASSQKNDAITRAKIDIRHRARLAARWLRKHQDQYSNRREAIQAIATQLCAATGDAEALINVHRKHARKRLKRAQNWKMVRLYSSGLTYAQIGKLLGFSSKTVSTRVKRAMANNGTDVKSSASDSRNLSTKHFQNGS